MMENEGTPQFKRIKTHLPKQSLCVPEEIVEEILLTLPVKSLLKFRCVSKPWRSLIDSKRFINKHLHTWTENSNFTHHNIILESVGPELVLKQFSLLPMLNDPFSDQFTFCDFENICWYSIKIVGSCNGLVCLLLDEQHFMLWNPSTRKTKKLPDMDGRLIKDGVVKNYGFGYDDLRGDYMVFGIAPLHCGGCGGGIYETICKVYSLQTNSWKKVKRGIHPPFDCQGKFASGKLHWRRLSGMGWDVVSFDLRSEAYDTVELPCSYREFDYKSIGVVGGRLSLVCDCFSYFDIWILKEYGVKESWEKVATLSRLHTTMRSPYEFLLGIGPNREILLTGRSAFGIYYPEGNRFRHCPVTNIGELRQAVIYVESLVPL